MSDESLIHRGDGNCDCKQSKSLYYLVLVFGEQWHGSVSINFAYKILETSWMRAT